VEPELLSSHGVMKELQGGAQCFMIFIYLEGEREEATSVISVVQEFEDVFSRKVPGTGPVSMALYCMAPVELVELKK